jgi:hypothetical protein
MYMNGGNINAQDKSLVNWPRAAERGDLEGLLIDDQGWGFARAFVSGAGVSGQPLPHLIHLPSTTNFTTRHTPIRFTLATRASSIVTERALYRLLFRRDACFAFWEDCKGDWEEPLRLRDRSAPWTDAAATTTSHHGDRATPMSLTTTTRSTRTRMISCPQFQMASDRRTRARHGRATVKIMTGQTRCSDNRRRQKRPRATCEGRQRETARPKCGTL